MFRQLKNNYDVDDDGADANKQLNFIFNFKVLKIILKVKPYTIDRDIHTVMNPLQIMLTVHTISHPIQKFRFL